MEDHMQRHAIVAHPFGTIKRQWGFDHIMTKKTKERASADVGFIFIAYNLKRIMNIIGIARLIDLFALFITVLWLENYRNQLKSRFYHHSTKITGTVKIS